MNELEYAEGIAKILQNDARLRNYEIKVTDENKISLSKGNPHFELSLDISDMIKQNAPVALGAAILLMVLKDQIAELKGGKSTTVVDNVSVSVEELKEREPKSHTEYEVESFSQKLKKFLINLFD